MDARGLTIAALLALALTNSAEAKLTQCRPAANCGAGGGPCTNWVTQGDTEELAASPAAGAAVIRVRLCRNGDKLCKDATGPSQQTVSVWGYAGADEVYSKVLNSVGDIDTGPYTKVSKLTRLAVRCNSVSGQHCKLIWQVCREELPLKPAN